VVVPETDRPLSDLAMRMLAPDASARPQSHREVLDALADIERALHHNVIRRRTSFWQYFQSEDGAARG
jgi:hypothetical protein